MIDLGLPCRDHLGRGGLAKALQWRGPFTGDATAYLQGQPVSVQALAQSLSGRWRQIDRA